MHKLRTLLSETCVRDGVDRLAQAITERYGDTPLTVVAVMTGSLVLTLYQSQYS